MGLVSDLGPSSPIHLLRENSLHSLDLLKRLSDQQNAMQPQEYHSLVPEICKTLSLANSPRDWLHPAAPDKSKALQLEIAVSWVEKCPDTELQLQLVVAISLYSNKDAPWSNRQLADISMDVAKNPQKPWLSQFAQTVFSRFLVVSGAKLATVANARSTSANSRFVKTRVARPALGLQIPSSTEDAQRAEWKSSENVAVLSSVVLLMACDGAGEYAAKCAVFCLNVMDDPDPLFRAQGCFLLQQMVALGHGAYLVRAGLVSVFEESVKTCLAYLPQLTPPETSLRLLQDGAYPALFSILDINKDTTYVTYLDILNSHLMASISHVSGRTPNDPAATAATNTLLGFFFSQTISNPFVIEAENGHCVVEAALGVQRDILGLANAHEDSSAAVLVLQYRLDFLAAWAILAKRVVKFGVGSPHIRDAIRENTRLIRELSTKAGAGDVEQDLDAVLTKVPELREII
ncbi:hypothetical protein JCM33374_g2986 [Metschnikowia sp. JCM 33374]|nr:hypothetical protein JCM33374_g2986 [Metschnikowia sp. JCM 33374]